jgi:UDP-N-acetyl-D-mannosaminuronic acid transferase (WecB/TagA/CpsF family)
MFTQPKHLFRRYLIEAPHALTIALRQTDKRFKVMK